jgi:hypothetical protein
VNENIPIYVVIWDQSPGVLSASILLLNNFLMSIILWDTYTNSSDHDLKLSASPNILAAILAPCTGGLEYIGLITNFNYDNKFFPVLADYVTKWIAPVLSPYNPIFLAKD